MLFFFNSLYISFPKHCPYLFQASTGESILDITAYDKKLGKKTPKVSLIKYEGANSRGKNKTANTVVSSSTKTSIMSTNANQQNANINRNYTLIESDSEYETEEVYELREWYPPDFWKSNQFLDSNSLTSNLNHLRNKAEESGEGHINNNNRKNKKQDVCLTDVTVDDLTITMMESQTEKGFFKTL